MKNKKRMKLLIVSMIFILYLSACGKKEDAGTDDPSWGQDISQTETTQSEGFDIEVARKNIIIKGQPFEIPVALGDLKDGWTWKENENSIRVSGAGLADIYFNGEEWFTAGLDNFYEGAEEKGVVYNLAIETEDCSIDGLVPYQSTKQEVIEKYGEPDEIIPEYSLYHYGTIHNDRSWPIKERSIVIEFDKTDKVIFISITYHLEEN